MKPFRLRLLCLLLPALFGVPARVAHSADDPVAVLTTTTDLADVVRIVGGDAVRVESLCAGPEDPHFLDARPSFVRMASRAELLVYVGMELEAGYLPLLLRDSANARIRPGAPGHLDASARIKKLDVPTGPVTRASGDVHASGNPHYLMDPANSVIVADEIARALGALRPGLASRFQANAKAWRATVADLLLGAPPPDDPKGARSGGLLDAFRPHEGARIVSFHADLAYLAARLRLEVLGTLEPLPGVPPTAKHLSGLAQRARAAGVKAVVYEVWHSEAQVRAFAAEIGATPVLLAHQPRAVPDAPDLLATYRRNARVLLDALAPSAPAK